MQKVNKSLDGLSIALVGDLLYGRTVHSLIYLLSLYKIKLYLVAPPALCLPEKYTKHLKEAGIDYREVDSLNDILGKLDIVYMTRVQRERFDSKRNYEKYKDVFILNKSSLGTLKSSASILHPLPRVNEIASEVDSDPRALYFEQVKNGLYVRMALLDYLFGQSGRK
jgi:aspartate carbamoyltransferase catalytic subunit